MQTAKTSKNSQYDNTKNIALKVENILARGNFGSANTNIIQARIFEALSGKKSSALSLLDNDELHIFSELPKHLQIDPDIVKKSLSKNPKVYYSLDESLKQDLEIQKMTIEEMFQKSFSVLEILSFIDKTGKNTKKLKKYINTYIQNYNLLEKKSLSELIYNLYISEYETYKLLLQAQILDDQGLSVGISAKTIDFIVQHTQSANFENKETLREELFGLLRIYLKLTESKLGEYTSKLLYIIVDCVDIDLTPTAVDESRVQDNDTSNEDESYDDERSIGPYSYVPISGTGNVSVSDSSGNSLVIDEQSLSKMHNDIAIQNYMNFYLRMCDLGIEFLLIKHSRKIQIATEVDFFEGSGMSEARVLKFFNKLGRRIGIPESSYEDTDGNREVLCFKTLGAAYLAFREIKSSGKVGKYQFDLASIGRKSPVEIFMKVEGIIDIQTGDFSIEAFRNSESG